MRDNFFAAKDEADEISLKAGTMASRAESVVRDFETVAAMDDAEYESRMVPARENVDTLEEIYTNNQYKPLLEMASDERTNSVNLLNNVKERFGGGESTGRCHGDRDPKDYSKHRLQPADEDNFEFTPGDISTIDADGNTLGHIDNSHIYDEYDQYDPESQSSSRYAPDTYESNEYDDEEGDDVVNPPLVVPEYNEPAAEEDPPKMETTEKEDILNYQLASKMSNNLGTGDNPCVTHGKLPAIVPNAAAKTEVENMLANSGETEAYVGLKATVSVPPRTWRWVSFFVITLP